MEIITTSASETKKIGREIGSSLKGGEIIAFSGNLGAGKTTFIQGLAEGMGVKNKIISPTFILMRTYKGHEFSLAHVDLYRLEGDVQSQVMEVGLVDMWKDKGNIMAIEWAEKIEDMLPSKTMWIKFESVDEDTRKIIIKK